MHEQLAPAFLDALVAEAGERVLGSWDGPDTTMGPMVDRRQRAVVDRQVRGALAAGAELLAGGEVLDGPARSTRRRC